MEAQSDSRLAKKAAVLSLVRGGAPVTKAAEAASVSPRSVWLWAEKDAAFGDALREAQKNRNRLVTEGQADRWKVELSEQEARAAALERDMVEVAAPARAGDESALERQAELRQQLAEARELIGGLQVAVESAEIHVQRAREQGAEEARQAAAAEAGEHHAAQIAAAERVDAALRELEAGWAEFTAAGMERDSALRKAGGRARHTHNYVLVQAVWKCAPGIAHALGLSAAQRTAKAAPLAEAIR